MIYSPSDIKQQKYILYIILFLIFKHGIFLYPSLPVSKESPALGFANSIATVICSTVVPDVIMKSPCHSPSSSLRRSRLSIPDGSSFRRRKDKGLGDEFKSGGSETPKVPSILVTSF